MDALSHSVYDVRDRRPDAAGAPSSVPEDDWSAAARKLRRQALAWTLAGISVWVLVASVAARYYARRLGAEHRAEIPVRWAGDRSASPLRLGADPLPACLVDDLEPPAFTEGAGAVPLAAGSVKLAAYRLARAEQAVRQKRYDEALDDYQKVAEMFPGVRNVQVSIAAAAMYLEQFELAAEAYGKAAQEGPLNASMANGLGVACLKIGDLDRAEQALLDALSADPGRANAYLNLTFLYLRRDQPAKAANYLERYLLVRPDDPAAIQGYALLLIRMQEWDRAARLLMKMIKNSPEVAPYHLQLALALAHLDQHEDALAALKCGTQLMDPKQALDRLSKSEYDLLREEPAFRDLLRELGAEK